MAVHSKKDQSTFTCITLVCKIKGAVSKGQRSLFVAHKMLDTSSKKKEKKKKKKKMKTGNFSMHCAFRQWKDNIPIDLPSTFFS